MWSDKADALFAKQIWLAITIASVTELHMTMGKSSSVESSSIK